MPTPTYEPIWSTTLATATTSVSIFGLPQTFKDLILVVEGWVTDRTGQVLILNGDSIYTNYYYVYAVGYGTSTSSSSGNSYGTNEVFENSSTNRTVMRLELMDYSTSNKHKSILIRADNATPNGTEMRAMRWANTAAVTSLTLTATGTTWGANTSFALYGIAG